VESDSSEVVAKVRVGIGTKRLLENERGFISGTRRKQETYANKR